MQLENKDESLDALLEIKGIMDRSSRFLSLSGWSGIWAGATALAGAAIAYRWLRELPAVTSGEAYDNVLVRFVMLALLVFIVALAGGFFFTYRKTKSQGQNIWNSASRMLIQQVIYPLGAGGIFSLAFIKYNMVMFIAPTCLAFYGVALISGSRYTLSEIRYLGILELALGCTAIFLQGYNIYFLAMGFGVLHILYGIIMWNRYERQIAHE